MPLINEQISKSFKDQQIPLVYEIKPLIYDDIVDTTIIHNILLIDDTVKDYDLFVKGSNLITFPIVYNYHSDRNELKTLLLSKFNNIDRIAFVFHNSNMYTKQFLNNQEFFSISNLEDEKNSNNVTNSDNVDFIISIINDLNIHHVDFLACNSLEYDIWKKYYNILQTKTNVIIGASNDATGNINYGGDWIMETTNEDIKNIYFNKLIDNYTHTLATTININSDLSTNNNIYIKQLSNNTIWYSTTNNSNDNTNIGTWTQINTNVDWQIVLNNTNTTKTEANRLKLTLLTDINIENINNCLIIDTDYITIDGNNKTITISGITNYPGLIQNGTGDSSTAYINTNGKNNIIIQNINIISSNSTLATYSGWICQAFYGNTSSGTNTILNCSNNGIITSKSGGIGGGFVFAFSTGTNIITNCKNMGAFSGGGSGGILGRKFAYLSSGSNTITNCTNSVTIYNLSAGIIGAESFESSSGTNLITNCTNTGIIGGNGAGGIISWSFAFKSSGSNTITNCINNGEISGTNSGGIVGPDYGELALVQSQNTISNCTNTGNISGSNAGGISGDWFGYNSSGINTITNCANTGNISGSYSGGITGANIAYTRDFTKHPFVTISDCYSIGTITSVNSGGICAGYDDASIYFTISSVTISNCYTLYGLIKASVQSDKVTFNISNIYEANNKWSTITALSSGNLLNKRNNLYVWAFPKNNSNIDQMNSPFILYSINPSNNPVTNLKAAGFTMTDLKAAGFTDYELLFEGYSINDIININALVATLQTNITTETSNRNAAISTEVTNRNTAISSAIGTEVTNRNTAISSAIATETNRAKGIENEIKLDVNKLNLVNSIWVQKINKSK